MLRTPFTHFLLALLVALAMFRQPLTPQTTMQCTLGPICAVAVDSSQLPPCCRTDHTTAPHCIIQTTPQTHYIFTRASTDIAPPVVLTIPEPQLIVTTPAPRISEPLPILPLSPQMRTTRSTGPRAPPACA